MQTDKIKQIAQWYYIFRRKQLRIGYFDVATH